jgi:hypothetical protein
MAKRNSTRRKAGKPKLIDVEGHQLTPAMYADYERCFERRVAMDKGTDPGWALRMSLDDFLSPYRPSSKIKGQLTELSSATMHAALAAGAMDNYTWFAANPASVRLAGCQLLRDLSQEFDKAARVLSALAGGMEAQGDMKIQGWLHQAAFLEQLGCSKEFAHGNR